MLAVEQRLRGRNDFTVTVRTGRRAGHGCIVVHLRGPEQKDPARAGARAGFVVPKALGPAVTRNKVRRRLRHLVRERLTRLPQGTDLVVRALPEASRRSFEELGVDLDVAIAAATRARSRAIQREATASEHRSERPEPYSRAVGR